MGGGKHGLVERDRNYSSLGASTYILFGSRDQVVECEAGGCREDEINHQIPQDGRCEGYLT